VAKTGSAGEEPMIISQLAHVLLQMRKLERCENVKIGRSLPARSVLGELVEGGAGQLDLRGLLTTEHTE